MHNVLFVQYVFLPTEQAETYLKILSMCMCLDIPFNIYLSQLVRLERIHDFPGNRDIFPMGKSLFGFQLLNTGLSFCTNSTLRNDNAFWTLFWCDKHTKAGMRKNISSIFV